MPTAPSPKRAEAKSMYLASGGKEKLRIIAEKIGVSEGTLRGWKSKDRWEEELSGTLRKKELERSAKKKSGQPKKRGAPKGNKNAVGNNGGAPAGQSNGNFKHGGYAEVYWDFLDEDERVLLEADMADEEDKLVEQIRLLDIRERRLMRAINQYREKPGGQSIASITKVEDKKEFGKDEEDERAAYAKIRRAKQLENMVSYFGHNSSVTTMTRPNIDIIKSLEATLTQVQGGKTRCITALAALRIQREKLGLEKLKMGVGDDDQMKRAVELLGGIESGF